MLTLIKVSYSRVALQVAIVYYIDFYTLSTYPTLVMARMHQSKVLKKTVQNQNSYI